MPIKPQAPRHVVENLSDRIQVTLTSKKSILKLLWFIPVLLLWGYMTGSIIYLFAVIVTASRLAESDPQLSGAASVPWMSLICLLPMFLFLLGIGGLAIYSLFWQVAGKEVIVTNAQAMTITRQILGWKRSSEYSSGAVKDLRVNMQQLNMYAPIRSAQKILGQDGMIAFDYGAKTFRFGLDIDEAEAKQIITALQQKLSA
jgi:hypothetical protein